MNERQPISYDALRKRAERVSLTKEVKSKDLPPDLTDATKIIDSLMIDRKIKRIFLLHFLFERGDWASIKKFEDIREEYGQGEYLEIANPFIYDNRLVDLYENFHLEYRRNMAIERLIKGVNYHDIHEEFDIPRDELRAARRSLFKKGKIKVNLSEIDLNVLKRRERGSKNKTISERIGRSKTRVRAITHELVLMGLIDPVEMYKSQVNEKRSLLDKIVDLDREGLNSSEIAARLGITDEKVTGAKDTLAEIGEISLESKTKIVEKSLIEGKNYHDISLKYNVDRDYLRAVRRDLFGRGKIDLGFSEDELNVLRRRRRGVENNQISKTTKIPKDRVDKITGKLLIMGLIDPLPGSGKNQVEENRKIYDKIVDLDRLGFSTKEISQRLQISYYIIRYAKFRLRDAGEIPNRIINKVAQKRKDESIAIQSKIKKILSKDPLVKVYDLPSMIPGITLVQAQRNTDRLVRKGELPKRKEARKTYLKKQLEEKMQEHLSKNPGKNFRLWGFIEEFRTDFYTALKIYEEIAKEKESPPLRDRNWIKKNARGV